MVGDQFTEEVFCSYLVKLKYEESIALWGYLSLIKRNEDRVKGVLGHYRELLLH